MRQVFQVTALSVDEFYSPVRLKYNFARQFCITSDYGRHAQFAMRNVKSESQKGSSLARKKFPRRGLYLYTSTRWPRKQDTEQEANVLSVSRAPVASEREFIADVAHARSPFPASLRVFALASTIFKVAPAACTPNAPEKAKRVRARARRSKHNFFISRPPSGLARAAPCVSQRFSPLGRSYSRRKNYRRRGGERGAREREREKRVTFLARGISFVRETLE